MSRVSSLNAAGRSYGQNVANIQENKNTDQKKDSQGRILNPLSNKPQDQIIYPDEIIRDSYGNIVSPYTPLEDVVSASNPINKHDQIGVLTDVNNANNNNNNDQGHHHNSELPTKQAPGKIPFLLPSYADGILNANIQTPQQNLLPPLSSGNYNYPSLNNNGGGNSYQSSTPKQTIDNSYQNEISSTFAGTNVQSTTTLNNELVPPPFTQNTGEPTYNFHHPEVNADTASNAFNQNPFLPKSSTVPSYKSNNLQLPTIAPNQGGSVDSGKYTGSFTQNKENVESTLNFHNPEDTTSNIFNQNPFLPKSTTLPTYTSNNAQLPTIVPNKGGNIDSGKYTGGFGGAPGILGNQAKPGYAVQPTVTPTNQVSAPLKPTENNQHSESHSHGTTNGSSYGSNFGSVQSDQSSTINQHHQNPVAIHNPTAISDSGKYTGGFGGPPGFLSPYDNNKIGKSVGSTSLNTGLEGNSN